MFDSVCPLLDDIEHFKLSRECYISVTEHTYYCGVFVIVICTCLMFRKVPLKMMIHLAEMWDHLLKYFEEKLHINLSELSVNSFLFH